MRRVTIKLQVGGVHNGGRVRNPDLCLIQTLRLETNHWASDPHDVLHIKRISKPDREEAINDTCLVTDSILHHLGEIHTPLQRV
ncbi:hypothetical protein SLEP1_g57609 [Rubroshorea leprosula]|uniref:Uncharacterized protein n=1 Tax=Rubroshorea leprosula TaxID=152421 RepID=A0AAV5MLQ7_9ROSI|nr:hypothetical protein SLEP1_g57609 [Rubroshorea leprosula]